MVVDADEDAARLLADLFRCMGHDVAVAHDGHLALAQADQLKELLARVQWARDLLDQGS